MRISDWSSDVCSSDLYTSGRTSNEAAFLYQLFVREFGTKKFPYCSNMCHEPSGTGMTPQIGVGKGTVSLHDFELAAAILTFGHPPTDKHPRMLDAMPQPSHSNPEIRLTHPTHRA